MPNVITLNVDNEASFWLRQFAEHAQYTALTTVEPELSRRAREIAGYAMDGARARSSAATFARALAELHLAILARMARGDMVSLLYPAFVEHMMTEERWYLRLLQNPQVSLEEAVGMAAWDGADAAAITGKLLDPGDPLSTQLAGYLAGFSAQLRKMQSSRRSPEETIAALSGITVLTHSAEYRRAKKIIFSGLADHDAREGEHASQIIRMFGA